MASISSKIAAYMAARSELDRMVAADAVIRTPEFRRFVCGGAVTYRHPTTGGKIDGARFAEMTAPRSGADSAFWYNLAESTMGGAAKEYAESKWLSASSAALAVEAMRKNSDMAFFRTILEGNVVSFRALASRLTAECAAAAAAPVVLSKGTLALKAEAEKKAVLEKAGAAAAAARAAPIAADEAW